jgi:hypothetical protein
MVMQPDSDVRPVNPESSDYMDITSSGDQRRSVNVIWFFTGGLNYRKGN